MCSSASQKCQRECAASATFSLRRGLRGSRTTPTGQLGWASTFTEAPLSTLEQKARLRRLHLHGMCSGLGLVAGVPHVCWQGPTTGWTRPSNCIWCPMRVLFPGPLSCTHGWFTLCVCGVLPCVRGLLCWHGSSSSAYVALCCLKGVVCPVPSSQLPPENSEMDPNPSLAPNYAAVALMAATGIPLAATNIFPFSIIGRDFGSDPNLALYMGSLNIFIVLPQLLDTLYSGKVRAYGGRPRRGCSLMDCLLCTACGRVRLERCTPHRSSMDCNRDWFDLLLENYEAGSPLIESVDLEVAMPRCMLYQHFAPPQPMRLVRTKNHSASLQAITV